MSCPSDESQCVELKRGDTLSYAGTVNLMAGSWGAECRVNSNDGAEVGQIAVTLIAPIAPETLYSIVLEANNTLDWPIGTLKSDIKFTDTGAMSPVVIHSPTFFIKVTGFET